MPYNSYIAMTGIILRIPVLRVMSPAWFLISILPIILINIVTNQYWRVLANIGVFIILVRIFLAPLKKNLPYNIIYIVIIIIASNAGLLLFISILDSLNIEELLNS